MEWIAWLAAAVIAAFLATVLRRYAPEQALAVGLLTGALLLFAAFSESLPLFRQLETLLSKSGVSDEYTTILFKALGVSLFTQLAADACRDAGEQGLAAKTELVGKLGLLTLAMPLFGNMAELALSLIGGTL